tara:strand:+ start:84 stop:230 length:147 start_codon:yes stop_codon:yes gene_type:complete
MNYTKYVKVKIDYENQEVWDESLKDIEELIKMMNNLSRQATIIEIMEE